MAPPLWHLRGGTSCTKGEAELYGVDACNTCPEYWAPKARGIEGLLCRGDGNLPGGQPCGTQPPTVMWSDSGNFLTPYAHYSTQNRTLRGAGIRGIAIVNQSLSCC